MPLLISIYIFSVFDLMMFHYFMRGIFEKRHESKWKNRCILAVASLVFILINSRQSMFVNLFACTSLLFVTAVVLYKGKIRALLFYEMIFYVVIALMETIAAFIITDLFGTSMNENEGYSYLENPLNVVIAKIMTYLAILLLESYLKKREIGTHGTSLKKTFFLPVTTLVLVMGILMSMNGDNTVMVIGSICLLFANVYMFYCIDAMEKAQEKNKEYELQRTQNEMKEIYYEKMEEISDEHRKYVHNLKDYLQTIGGLAAQGDSEEILALLKDMETEVESIREKRYTGNNILNALLCEKESIAKKRNIVMQIEPAAELTFSFAKDRDLIVMVGNLLDNAIDAAQQCEERREIRMYFSQQQGNFEVIQIDNSYNGETKKEGERFLTTKKDKEHHGYGLKSVQETAEKYGGVLILEQKYKIFSATLLLSRIYYDEEKQ